MQSTIRQLRIEFLKAQLEANSRYCHSLAQKFEAALTTDQKTELVHRWDEAMKDQNRTQRLLEQLEKLEREETAGTGR